MLRRTSSEFCRMFGTSRGRGSWHYYSFSRLIPHRKIPTSKNTSRHSRTIPQSLLRLPYFYQKFADSSVVRKLSKPSLHQSLFSQGYIHGLSRVISTLIIFIFTLLHNYLKYNNLTIWQKHPNGKREGNKGELFLYSLYPKDFKIWVGRRVVSPAQRT